MDSPTTPEISSALLASSSQEDPSTLAGASFTGGVNRHKLNSQDHQSSSMTPPPSSQIQSLRAAASNSYRDGTPPQYSLSSPPPTTINGFQRDSTIDGAIPSVEQLTGATKEEIRVFLDEVLAANKRLEAVAAEARMSAAHYKLQHNLLTIETEEAAKRMEVEHEMTKREVSVLQQSFQSRDSPGQDYLAKVKTYCSEIEEDKNRLERRLKTAMKIIEQQDDDLASGKEKEQLLLRRIRENREHLNYLRSPGGLFHIATPQVPTHSYPSTPQQYRSTPKNTPMTSRSRHGRGGSQEPFAALLLADQMLSQENRENNSAPSTPIVGRRIDQRTPIRHNRGVHSLSSLPSTPHSAARSRASNSTLLPSVQFKPQSDSRERRRRSRDSTISASDNGDVEEIAAVSSFRGESEEVYESQASQTAAQMLRFDPRESFEVEPSRTNTPTPVSDKSNLLQSKIYGSVTKGVVEKRKRGDDERTNYSAKKFRTGEDGIGLGIGFEPKD